MQRKTGDDAFRIIKRLFAGSEDMIQKSRPKQPRWLAFHIEQRKDQTLARPRSSALFEQAPAHHLNRRFQHAPFEIGIHARIIRYGDNLVQIPSGQGETVEGLHHFPRQAV